MHMNEMRRDLCMIGHCFSRNQICRIDMQYG